MEQFLRLMLWRNVDAGSGTFDGIRLPRCDEPAEILVFLALLIFGLFAIHRAYHRDADWVPQRRRSALAWIRFGVLTLVLFMVSGAFVALRMPNEGSGTVMVLIDRSKSMSLIDPLTGDARSQAQVILGDAAKVGKVSRHEMLTAAFARAELDPIRTLSDRFKVETLAFGEGPSLAPIGNLLSLSQPAERASQLGAAISDAAKRARGRRLEAVILASDGGWNRGEDPVDAAKRLGAPVLCLGIGAPQAKDLAIAFLTCDDMVFLNDQFTLALRIRNRGYEGRAVRLTIRRIDEAGNEEVVKEESLELDERREFEHEVALLSDKAGVFTYQADLAIQPDEANTVNNRKARSHVTVMDKKLRVLVVDDTPRWEFRFLRGLLEADRQRIQPTFLLRQADTGLDTQGSTFVTQFPADAKALGGYDCIVLGDVAPDLLSESAQRALTDWVRNDSGGLVALAGRRAMPALWSGTQLERLLPIEPDPRPAPTVADDLARSLVDGIQLAVTPAGSRWSALHFSTDPVENLRLWQQATPVHWVHGLVRTKSGAASLVVNPDRMLGDQPLPVIAAQQYGRGQVVWMGTDETWRWRFRPGVALHRRMWGQIITALGMTHLAGASERVRIETDQDEYAVGDQVQIVVRALGADLSPLVADQLTIAISRELTVEQVHLAGRRDQPGIFTGSWVPSVAGRHRLAVADAPGVGERSVLVTEPRLEQDDGGIREDLLRQVAKASSGIYLPLHQADRLRDAVIERQKPAVMKREEVALWNAPMVMLMFVVLLGIEWWFRKRWDML
jgi:hypothetical protein